MKEYRLLIWLDEIFARAKLSMKLGCTEPNLSDKYLHLRGARHPLLDKKKAVANDLELGERFAQVSGYTLAAPAESSSYAGYKDWFIQAFRRPGYTIEVGSGVNPLPLSQFDEIYRDNLGILVTAALGT